MSQNGQTHFKILQQMRLSDHWKSLSDHFGTLCVEGLKRFRKIHRKTPVLGSHFNKVADLLFSGQHKVFSCEYCEMFKNIFFTEHLWMTD